MQEPELNPADSVNDQAHSHLPCGTKPGWFAARPTSLFTIGQTLEQEAEKSRLHLGQLKNKFFG